MDEAAMKKLGVTRWSLLEHLKTDDDAREYGKAMFELGRLEALEEAAKVAEDCCSGCAATIRALISPA